MISLGIKLRQTALNDRVHVKELAVSTAWYVVKLRRPHGHVRDWERIRRQHAGLLQVAAAWVHIEAQWHNQMHPGEETHLECDVPM